MTEELHAVRARIAGIADMLNADELRALEMVAEGLARGRGIYGELRVATDRRDFRREASAELRDAPVYVAAQLIRLECERGLPLSLRHTK